MDAKGNEADGPAAEGCGWVVGDAGDGGAVYAERGGGGTPRGRRGGVGIDDDLAGDGSCDGDRPEQCIFDLDTASEVAADGEGLGGGAGAEALHAEGCAGVLIAGDAERRGDGADGDVGGGAAQMMGVCTVPVPV